MKIQKVQQIKLRFPLHLYFQQLFTPDLYVKFISPFSFWRRYRINYLETCWEFNWVRHLENCRKIDWQPEIFQKVSSSGKRPLTSISRGLLWEKTPKTTILIAQPTIQLKYRGVTYYINQRLDIDINSVKTQSDRITLDKAKILTDCNSNYISQSDSTIN
jgi:hypothetical protein